MVLLSKPLKVSLTIAGVMLAVIVTIDLLRPVAPEDRLRALRPELTALRGAADSCVAALDREEERLSAADARFDSLRGLIERYEGLDERGVPADSYAQYLEAFNSYNEGIPARTAAGETLKAHWAECRSIVVQHNQLADSARDLAEEAGLVPDTVRIPIQ